MTHPDDPGRPIDPERIAALIDGKLSDADREALMAELDASPEAFEVYADAVAALRDDEEDEARTAPAATVIPLQPRQPRGRLYAAVGAIAAALIVIVALPLLRGSGSSAESPQELVALLDRPNDARPLTAAVLWNEQRGADDAVAARARAVRIGVRIVDLEVLVRSGDAADATRVARQIASMFDAISGGSVAATAYRAIADSSASAADARQSAASFAEQVAGVSDVRLGAWLEAARMAAASQDSAFFTRAPADRALSAVSTLSQNSAASIGRLRELLGTSPRDWSAIQAAVAFAIRELAGPGA